MIATGNPQNNMVPTAIDREAAVDSPGPRPGMSIFQISPTIETEPDTLPPWAWMASAASSRVNSAKVPVSTTVM